MQSFLKISCHPPCRLRRACLFVAVRRLLYTVTCGVRDLPCLTAKMVSAVLMSFKQRGVVLEKNADLVILCMITQMDYAASPFFLRHIPVTLKFHRVLHLDNSTVTALHYVCNFSALSFCI